MRNNEFVTLVLPFKKNENERKCTQLCTKIARFGSCKEQSYNSAIFAYVYRILCV